MKLKTKKNKKRKIVPLSSLTKGDAFYHSDYDTIVDAINDSAIHLVTDGTHDTTGRINLADRIIVVNVVTGHIAKFFLECDVVEVEGEIKLSEKK